MTKRHTSHAVLLAPRAALDLIIDHTPVLGSEEVALSSAVDRVLARAFKARESLPPFDNSAMDGYAVRAADLAAASTERPVSLRVREEVRAGDGRRLSLKPGEAARIMTGAPMPGGADAVVMQEVVDARPDRTAVFTRGARRGAHIRPAGEDVRAGTPLLARGCLLRPYEIALLAAQGVSRVQVTRRPLVAVLATGDELVVGHGPVKGGSIRNSNGPALLAALARWSIPALDLGTAPDDPRALRRKLSEALRRADVVLVTGGVSVGDHDHTRRVLASLGVEEVFWRAAIKPGKPLLFGVRGQGRLVFGLPGNPLASLVCIEEFVRPALEKMQGLSLRHQSYHLVGTARNDYPKPEDRQQYLFCRAAPTEDGYALDIIRPQGSAMMGMAVRANALAAAPVGLARVKKGMTLPFRWLK